ncbi:MAG TPA: PIN domain-containing protein [Pyrinomonadaceae bacterium]|nr:PIN domain-containing protein [Pyrinomonadaceae bacterium]
MSTVLLNTTVASLLHPKKNDDVLRGMYESEMEGQILAVSFQSVAELWAWAEENNWGTTLRGGLEIFLQKFLVIPYDSDLAKTWARLSTHCKRIGRRLEAGDAWIAASAAHYTLTLLTHDLDHVSLNFPGLNVVYYP